MDSGKPVFMSGVLRPAYSSLWGPPPPQALTLLGGARFFDWDLRRFFSGKCRRDPWYFCANQACLGYGPALGPT